MPSASATERGTPTGAACAVAQADGRRARFWAVRGREGASRPRRDEKSGRLWTAAARVAPPAAAHKQLTSVLDFYEVKMDASRISLSELERKRMAFFEKNPNLKNHEGSYDGLSLADL